MTNATIVACMKNEGPFILEWLAHHQAVGFNRFIIFSNDCSDQSNQLLNTLDDAGVIRHLENPNRLMQSPKRLHVAFEYARWLKEYQRADYVALIDADEFINIHVGDGTLTALFQAIGDFDILSLNHVNFGFNGILEYQDRLLTDQFILCEGAHIDKNRTRRSAIKSIHKNGVGIAPLNHFPGIGKNVDGLIWKDGSGRERPINPKGRRKMLPAFGQTNLAQINHYVLRSLESFIVKQDRGNVIGFERWDGVNYANRYNTNSIEDRSILKSKKMRLNALEKLLGIPSVLEAHEKCISAHKEKIQALRASENGKVLFEALLPLL